MDQALSQLTGRQTLAAVFLGFGALVTLAGLTWSLYGSGKAREAATARAEPDGSSLHTTRGVLSLLVLVIAAGFLLRMYGLEAKTLSHTEAMVPGIGLPDGISWPPNRDSFYDLFWFHFHGEGHPQAYYFLMWGWVKAFGTSLTSVRLPSVLFGTASIGVAFLLGKLAFDRRVGLVAAALVAFSGLHVYFSQYARLFMMGCFLALLSTLLLARLLRASTRPRLRGAGYVFISGLAVYTQTFFWTVLAAHMLWVTLLRDAPPRLVRRLLSLQALVVVLGAPSLAHVIYRGDDVDLAGPSFAFVADYLTFGFAFNTDPLSIPPRSLTPLLAAAALTLSVTLLVAGLLASRNSDPRSSKDQTGGAHDPGVFDDGPPIGADPTRTASGAASTGAVPTVRLALTALGSALVILGFVLVVLRHQLAVAAVMAVPFLALAIPRVGGAIHAAVASPSQAPGWVHSIVITRPERALVGLLAFLPALIVVLLSFWTSMLIPRAFLMFVPFILIVISAGALTLARRRWLIAPVAAALVVLNAAGVVHHRRYPNDAIDYGGVGTRIAERVRADDLVLVVPDLWVFSALYYYLRDSPPRYVAGDYAGTVARNPGSRVWLLFFDSARWGAYGTATEAMTEAVTGYRAAESLQSRRALARLYVRDE